MSLNTERLILRPWKQSDLEPFFLLNSDPRVMEFFPSLLSREESDKLANKIQDRIERNGWGFWAVEVPNIAEFIGMIGLNHADLPFGQPVEVGWRLSFDYWGKGYALEGAKASLKFGFETLNLNEIVSFTAVQNWRSRRVMERLGMHHETKDDFEHPKIPEGHPLRKHVLYRLSKNEYDLN